MKKYQKTAQVDNSADWAAAEKATADSIFDDSSVFEPGIEYCVIGVEKRQTNRKVPVNVADTSTFYLAYKCEDNDGNIKYKGAKSFTRNGKDKSTQATVNPIFTDANGNVIPLPTDMKGKIFSVVNKVEVVVPVWDSSIGERGDFKPFVPVEGETPVFTTLDNRPGKRYECRAAKVQNIQFMN